MYNVLLYKYILSMDTINSTFTKSFKENDVEAPGIEKQEPPKLVNAHKLVLYVITKF